MAAMANVMCGYAGTWQLRAASQSGEDGLSYLSMWKRARLRHEQQLQQELSSSAAMEAPHLHHQQSKDSHFATILQVPPDERDKAQRLQMIHRADSALAAARALLAQLNTPQSAPEFPSSPPLTPPLDDEPNKRSAEKIPQDSSPLFPSFKPPSSAHTIPGPDFWTWSPVIENKEFRRLEMDSPTLKTQSSQRNPLHGVVLEKQRPTETLDIVTERMAQRECDDLSFIFESREMLSLPPLQSLVEVHREGTSQILYNKTLLSDAKCRKDGTIVMQTEPYSDTGLISGTNSDGSQWSKETGEELRENGVICKWTLAKGVSMDGVEWEEKIWEAFDESGYKELGAEKSGRDANGNAWHEVWKEAMWQDLTTRLLHIENMADKWAKQSCGAEWHENWFEHYDTSGFTDKRAEKWSKIDPATPLEPGHAHVWHERWGENYDGQGGSTKYTDKWAERADCTGKWSKWGDKWDEHFDKSRHGVKQGETWWEGENGERWSRTWGEQHNGTGWIHKYGKSSSGEHWDTHEQQETWYESYPHYGFSDCFQNSSQLQRVGLRKKSSF